MSTNNKVALVTGGSRGLGKDMSIQLAKKGFDVILTYQNNKEAAEEVVSEIQSLGKKAIALQIDVAQSNSFESFANTVKEALINNFDTPQLHSLVNNAGIGAYAPFESTTEEEFENMINIHLKAPYFLTQKMLPIISDGGSIVNISTGLVRFTFNNYSAYAIAKAGVESLSRYQALELSSRKIRVNTVAPGAIATDFGGGAFRDNKKVNDMIANSTALGRVGLPDDIGSVVAFLCSEDAKWINAQKIEVAGGIYI
ncbi:MAG TPA: SDR family oxidoreductase [Arachidicoccus soli]|uniref:SDR family oxidoreductase n=1 Tax=Arachidicoccus soli TaxID=2341117 RepID=A0A386HPH1_9BACT|nr:SDR family oxidoreductase [Arachidicoccus soli]AYD47735.1 SDR family oxidoreductase [Arachidicoccus soli]HEU0227397.1 SDR family oxidoreductase [Arachidicoccus soli]